MISILRPWFYIAQNTQNPNQCTYSPILAVTDLHLDVTDSRAGCHDDDSGNTDRNQDDKNQNPHSAPVIRVIVPWTRHHFNIASVIYNFNKNWYKETDYFTQFMYCICAYWSKFSTCIVFSPFLYWKLNNISNKYLKINSLFSHACWII